MGKEQDKTVQQTEEQRELERTIDEQAREAATTPDEEAARAREVDARKSKGSRYS